MSPAYRSAGVTHGQRSALRLLQTDRSDGTASPRFAPTTNMPAHNNDRIDTQSGRVTGDLSLGHVEFSEALFAHGGVGAALPDVTAIDLGR
jgi:hypothetical protein